MPKTVREQPATEVPLVVDLDETLVRTDTLYESALLLIRQNFLSILFLPFWLIRGRSFLKAAIANAASLQPETLPYREDVLKFLIQEHATGRKLVLATAAHRSIAEAVANHLGIFTVVLASDEAVNLKGRAKREALTSLFGQRGFDYIGDSQADVKVWEASRIAHVAGSKANMMRQAEEAGASRGQSFVPARPGLRTWLRAIRIHQWVKNTLIFVPLILAHRAGAQPLALLAGAFLAFSTMASGTYVINDLLDLTSDRRHPRKRLRPFASGDLSITQGLSLAAVLLCAGLGAAAWLGWGLLACCGTYLLLTLAYSAYLKKKPILDVVVLAFLYTMRLIVGGVAAHVYLSPWLFQFSIFLFLSLAFVKRYSELHRLQLENKDARARGYAPVDLGTISQTGIAAGLLAALVLALYVNSPEILRLYPRPHVLWAACPLFIYWISRIWLIARRGEMDEDPILFAFRDPASYGVAVCLAAMVLLGSIVP